MRRVKGNQRFGQRSVSFHGRTWTADLVDCRDSENLADYANIGRIKSLQAHILIRYINDEQAIMTALHEILHECFPHLAGEFDEERLDRAEAILKDAMEAFGVDLSPMLNGYK